MSDLQNIDQTILDNIKRLQETFDALGVPMPRIPERRSIESDKAYGLRLKAWCWVTRSKLQVNLNKSCSETADIQSDGESYETAERIAAEINAASEELRTSSNQVHPILNNKPTATEDDYQTIFKKAHKPFSWGRIANIFITTGLLLGLIVVWLLIINTWAGNYLVYSLLRSCETDNKESQISSFYSTQPSNNIIEETSTVYICTSPNAKRFHRKKNCKGLNNCSFDIEELTAYEAADCWYTPCGYCYSKTARDRWNQSRTE